MIVGMARVNRDSFVRVFDVGVLFEPSSAGNEEVLLFYSDESTLPYNKADTASLLRPSSNITGGSNSNINSSTIPLILSPEEATKQCMTVKMVLVEPQGQNMCLAIMAQDKSYSVYKWMRVADDDAKAADAAATAALDYPLRLVS